MKKYKLILSLFLLNLLFIGCEDELDIEPAQSISTDVALSTGENIENILIGAYSEAGEYVAYGGFLPMFADLFGFSDQATWRGTFTQPREVFTKRIFVDNTLVRDIWMNAYEVINQSNLVLDHIELVDEERQNTVSGEAYFLRALNYFDLVRLFAPQYEAGTQNDQPGVPLSLEGIVDYSGDLRIPRSSVEEVYAQVIADLQQAYDLLPPENSFFADKYAAQALLARVYLQQGNYAAARDAADDVIENSGHSLNSTYAAAFNNDVDTPEDVFAFQVTTQSGANELVVHYAEEEFGGRGGDITINQEYLDLFGADDERGSFVYANANGEPLTSKYTNQYGNIPLIRLAELYLIRAEANLREGTAVGNTPAADVNILRERANAAPLSDVTLEDILEERELELLFEGHLVHDYTRTGRAVGETDADELIFPIPQREMDANTLLEQNSLYGS